MGQVLLQESTLEEICEELSKRELNYVFTARYITGSPEDSNPFLKFHIKTEFMVEMIGLTELAKAHIVESVMEDGYEPNS